MLPDTGPTFVWTNEEIFGFYRIQTMQWQSAQFFSGPSVGRNLPDLPVSILRVVALMLDAQANNSAKLAAITKLLDINLNPAMAAKAFHDQADALRQVDDDAGAFAVIEQIKTTWDWRDRMFKQYQRQSG